MNQIKLLFCSILSILSLNVFSQEEEFLSGEGPSSEFVMSLHLYDKGLKELPDNFAKWHELEVLFLDDNQLTALPPSIKYLSKLREISIPRNKFTSFPKEILEMKNLKTLDIAKNQIQNIPAEIGQLSKLEYVLFSGTGIKEIPESICQLQNLEMLALSDNQLKTLPTCMKGMKNLQYLYVDGNPFDSFPTVITEMVQLKSLDLNLNESVQFPPEIKNLKNLETVYMNPDYYKKNKSKIDKLLPKNCQVNPPPPPPPTIEPIAITEDNPSEINEVIANQYCFNLTEKTKKEDLVAESNYILEFGDYLDRARLIKESSEYDEKKKLEAEKEGLSIVSKIYMEFSDGTYKIDNGSLIYSPENSEKKIFKIKYDSNKKIIKELTDNKKQIWKPGSCYAAPPSIGF